MRGEERLCVGRDGCKNCSKVARLLLKRLVHLRLGILGNDAAAFEKRRAHNSTTTHEGRAAASTAEQVLFSDAPAAARKTPVVSPLTAVCCYYMLFLYGRSDAGKACLSTTCSLDGRLHISCEHLEDSE